MTRSLRLLTIAAAGVLLFAPHSDGAPILIGMTPAAPAPAMLDVPPWSWSFDETAYVIDPRESVVVNATLRNDSPDALHITGVSASFGGDLQKEFRFTFGPTGSSSDFGLELLELTLPPGAEVPFVYGILRPRGFVAPGLYPADPAALGLLLEGHDHAQRFSDNTFTIQMNVPEPSPATLLLTGLGAALGLGIVRLRRGTRAPCH